MDALAITEETGLEFASEYNGFMHACGHDGHMAMLLGFAQWLSENKAGLKENVVLLFQPSEESVGGALPMIQEGALSNPAVDCIFGWHIMPEIPQGKIGLKAGALMASTSEFSIDIHGVSAHGAMPHRGIDSIVAAAHFITMLQGILTRRIDPFQQALVTIGKLQAGEARNILAPDAHMEGIMRTFDSEVSRSIKQHIQELLKGLEASHGVMTEYKEHVWYPPVINHPELAARLEEIIPHDMLHPINPMMIAEDFSFYQQRVPGVFLYLGSKSEELGFTNPLHSSCFQFDEEILLTGIQLNKNILLSFY
jgi:amidohydrolase